jgi:hypothetical protein
VLLGKPSLTDSKHAPAGRDYQYMMPMLFEFLAPAARMAQLQEYRYAQPVFFQPENIAPRDPWSRAGRVFPPVDASRGGKSGDLRLGAEPQQRNGDPAAVDAMVRWAQHGPQLAQVERVDIDPTDGDYSNFEIIN